MNDGDPLAGRPVAKRGLLVGPATVIMRPLFDHLILPAYPFMRPRKFRVANLRCLQILTDVNDARLTPHYTFCGGGGGTMSEQNDLEYFANRAAVERALSDTASEPGIALIHSQLADRYELLASGFNQPRPALRVVSNG
jgi:hypothetical protein